MDIEKIRVIARKFFGYRSPVYKAASGMLNLFFGIRSRSFAALLIILLPSSLGTGRWVSFRKLRHPIYLRSVREDASSIINNIFREEYGRLPRDFTPYIVIDAGAYIGDTSAYFLSRFPLCRVIALEPNPETYYFAEKNLSLYGRRAALLNAALAPEKGVLTISGETTGARVSESGVQVSAVSIEDILTEEGIGIVDILKIDIEGYEYDVLMHHNSRRWVRSVRWLLLETHGDSIIDAVIPFLEENNFEIKRYRNVWYCRNTLVSCFIDN